MTDVACFAAMTIATPRRDNDIDLEPDELGRDLGGALLAALRPAIFDRALRRETHGIAAYVKFSPSFLRCISPQVARKSPASRVFVGPLTGPSWWHQRDLPTRVNNVGSLR
jgi:hypothetical protein